MKNYLREYSIIVLLIASLDLEVKSQVLNSQEQSHDIHIERNSKKSTNFFKKQPKKKQPKPVERRLFSPSNDESLENAKLERLYNLPPEIISQTASIKDEGLKGYSDEVHSIMRKLGPVLSKNDPQTELKDYLKMAEKKLKKSQKKQIKAYDAWRAENWANIQKYLFAKQKIYDKDDSLNVMENEKFYQLFLVEDSEKRENLISLNTLQTNVIRKITDFRQEIYDAEKVKQASIKESRKIMKRLKKRHRKVRKDGELRYLDGVRLVHAEFMRDWQRNQKFLGVDLLEQ